MDDHHLPSLITAFAELPDPSDLRSVRHLLVNLMTISVLAVICGANTFAAIHQHAQANEDWLRHFFTLRFDLLSQDTFERFYSELKHFVSYLQKRTLLPCLPG